MQGTEPSARDNLEGRGQEGSGRRGHMYAYGQFILTYSKNHHNGVK